LKWHRFSDELPLANHEEHSLFCPVAFLCTLAHKRIYCAAAESLERDQYKQTDDFKEDESVLANKVVCNK
jgi:hypothetical protein